MLNVVPRRRSDKNYLLIFAITAVFMAVAFGIGQTTLDNFHCRSSQYGDHEFLAYCESIKYGDYEHGALYYGLEPGLRRNIRDAQVLFLGSSRLQAAFSTKAVRNYFQSRGIRFFVMGFGYGETSPFASAVLQRSQASPKLLVINADPFFEEVMSEPAKEIIEGPPTLLWRLVMKMAFQRVHRVMCLVVPSICPESQPAIFRSAEDGQWNWIGPFTQEQAIPIGPDTDERLAQYRLEQAEDIGELFLRRIGIDRRCVVLTGIPNSRLNSPEIAEALAASLHTWSLTPKVGDLATLDRGHLNQRSAELWSAAFLAALTPAIDLCLGR